MASFSGACIHLRATDDDEVAVADIPLSLPLEVL
jgi:hypothetical protein